MGEASASAVFGTSAALSGAVNLINTEVPDAKLPKLLQKILEKLHLPDEAAFSAEEVSYGDQAEGYRIKGSSEESLCDAFEIDASQLTAILDTISFLFETIAYKQLGPQAVVEEAKKVGLGEVQATAFGKVWATRGPNAIKKLRDRAFFAREATDVSWRLNLMLSQASQAKAKRLNALFEVNVASKNDADDTKVQMEFTHTELFKFFTQLEIIQQQLDQLS